MKKTSKSPNGTSFHGDVFNASVSDLRKILGIPVSETNDGRDKVNFEWVMENEEGEVFTVYDWKEYRVLDENELIEWHIGGHSSLSTDLAVNEIAGSLNELDE
jgi:hypothetical protein